MNQFVYSLVTFFIFFVGYSICIINDTVLSDSWDDCEAFHADFSPSEETSDECVILENQSMTYEPDQSDETASAMQTEILDESHFIPASPLLINNSNQLEELLSGMQNTEPEETSIETPIPHHPQSSNENESTSDLHNDIDMTEPEKKVKQQRKFVTIGQGSRKAWGKMKDFENLIPGLLNSKQLLTEEVPKILDSLGEKHQWKELREYPIKNYYGYWANVCDYFWKKPALKDEPFRGCYVNTYIFPESNANIEYIYMMYFKSTKVEILKCQCYFYLYNNAKPSPPISKFAVHKYRTNEYFILEEVSGPRNSYRITDLLTRVYLPNPKNNSMIQQSNRLEESRTEQQSNTRMIAGSACQPRRYRSLKKFLTIGNRSKIGHKMSAFFQNVIPGKSNPHNLTQEQLEKEFISHKNKPRWEELKEYSLDKYLGYWGNVCDYFWKKPTPNDERFRGCYVRTAYYPRSSVTLVLTHILESVNPRKLDVLQCQCYYYIKYLVIPDSNQTDFAIHKHRDNEYFVLDKVPDIRYGYKISDLLTEVYLPDPVV